MSKIALYVLAAIGGLVVVLAAVFLLIPQPEYRVYDCNMAEWHPDIPKEVREHCRKLNRNQGIVI